jgi:phytoene dehydrogenase-like protein
MKVLIVEKNAKPGGYCTSLKRQGYHFDACAHSLGSLREGGHITKVLQELNIAERIGFTRYNPSDIIITPDHKISFWNDLNATISEFQGVFPQESANIEQFFNFIYKCQGESFIPLRHITFQSLLDKYFRNNKLKSVLSLPIFGNTGCSVSELSAFTAVTVFKEFLLDGGYYPTGGMQQFPDLLMTKFKELGGEALLSKSVKKIRIKNDAIEGVVLKDDNFMSAKLVVSNADACETFLNMIGSDLIPNAYVNILNNMAPSLSMFILYLGIDGDFDELPNESSSIWYLPNYNMEDMFLAAKNGEVDNLDWFLLKISDDRKSILRFVNSPFLDTHYWKLHKERLVEVYIKKTEKLIKNLSKHIVFRDAATPSTLSRWTMNYKGAAYGWAGIPSQFMVNGISKKTMFSNLYMTGHWATLFQGIPGVVYLGRDTAKTILYKWTKA